MGNLLEEIRIYMNKGYSTFLRVSVCLVLVLAIAALSGCASSTPASSSTAPTTTSPVASVKPTTTTPTPTAPIPQPGQVLKIGMITPSTGPAAEKGAPGGDAVLDAMQYINNELGGAGGYPIQVSWIDSQYVATNVVNAVNKFMGDGDLLFTAMSSYEATAAMGITNRAGFPGLATFTAPSLYRPPQHLYGQMPDYGDDWTAFAKYYLANIWKGSGKPTMALELLNNSTGAGAKDAARAMADTLGINVPSNLIFEHAATTMDETTNLTTIKNAKPDVLFISSTPNPTAVILKNAKTLGMIPGMTIGLAHASFTKALVDLAGADVTEGVYGVYPTVTWEDNAPGIAKAKEYLMKNHPKDAGNMDYLSCWTTSLVSAEVLKQAVKSVGYAALAKGDASAWAAVEQYGIQKLNYDVAGLQGPVNYTPGDNRLDKAVKVYTIKAGTIVPVTDWIATPMVKYEDLSWWGK
jgi:branched-chain amino acid transport system substrate-binding protein